MKNLILNALKADNLKLSKKERREGIAKLKNIYGMTYREIGKELGIHFTTVMHQVKGYDENSEISENSLISALFSFNKRLNNFKKITELNGRKDDFRQLYWDIVRKMEKWL